MRNDLLIFACEQGSIPLARFMIFLGANPRHNKAESVWVANLYRHYDLVDFLMRKGAILQMALNKEKLEK